MSKKISDRLKQFNAKILIWFIMGVSFLIGMAAIKLIVGGILYLIHFFI